MRVFLLAAIGAAAAQAASVTPVEKVIEMLSKLQGKVTHEGEVEEKEYQEFADWCEDEARNKQFEIKTGKGQVEDLEAQIEKASSDIDATNTRIEELSASIATGEKDLATGTELRKKERADFEAAERELVDAVDTLGRAVGILERELGGKSLMQLDAVARGNVQKVLLGLSSVVSASRVSHASKAQLAALLQQTSEEEGPAGAPAAAVYENKSGAIVDLLKDMLEKAEAQKEELRRGEMEAQHNFDMLRQGLETTLKHERAEMEAAKKSLAGLQEAKAQAEGELAVTQADLDEDVKYLQEVQHDCMTRAAEFEQSVRERKGELEVLAKAKKIIQEAMNPGETAAAFVQVAASSTAQAKVEARVNKRNKVLALLRQLASEHHDYQLSNLAMKLVNMVSRRSLVQLAADPFAKVKGLIQNMIERLVKEAAAEAKQKAFCDKEMGETEAKKGELEETVDDLTAKIDKAQANIGRLTNEVATLQEELAALAKSQQDMNRMRTEQHEAFVAAEQELSQGLDGVRTALQVLRDYYAKKDEGEETEAEAAALVQTAKHEKSTSGANGIISMLEVIESDLARNLAEARTAEDEQVDEHKRVSHENEVTKVAKTKDVQYKSSEAAKLKTVVNELSQDREGRQTELEAVLEYYDKLKPQCVAKPESYEERKKRREAEIAGLKNALEILEGEAMAFLQKRK